MFTLTSSSIIKKNNAFSKVSFFFSNKFYSQCIAVTCFKGTALYGSKINSMNINRRKKN